VTSASDERETLLVRNSNFRKSRILPSILGLPLGASGYPARWWRWAVDDSTNIVLRKLQHVDTWVVNEYRKYQLDSYADPGSPEAWCQLASTKADSIIYQSSQLDGANCPMQVRCCPNTPIRKIARSIHEPARDVARAVAKTRLYKQSRKDRKKVEMLFAHLKRIYEARSIATART
jgi:hypothetical protein